MAQNDLKPLAPQDALDWYLEHRRDGLRTATRRKHRSALGTFVDWTGEAGIGDMNNVGGRQLSCLVFLCLPEDRKHRFRTVELLIFMRRPGFEPGP